MTIASLLSKTNWLPRLNAVATQCQLDPKLELLDSKMASLKVVLILLMAWTKSTHSTYRSCHSSCQLSFSPWFPRMVTQFKWVEMWWFLTQMGRDLGIILMEVRCMLQSKRDNQVWAWTKIHYKADQAIEDTIFFNLLAQRSLLRYLIQLRRLVDWWQKSGKAMPCVEILARILALDSRARRKQR